MVAAVAAEVIDGGSGGRKEDNGGIRACPQAAYFLYHHSLDFGLSSPL